MNTSRTHRRFSAGFTLIELLVVIAIIGILAAMLLPALAAAKIRAQVRQAQLEMTQITTAINSYHSTYSRYPVSTATMTLAAGGDFTFGDTILGTVLGAGPWTARNSEVISILMANTNSLANANHIRNPQQVKFLNPAMARDTASPGVGPDLVYRDPWGNPYIISLDLNYDEKCLDVFYKLRKVSQPPAGGSAGINGLSNPVDANGIGDNFQLNATVMVWSFGPDGKANMNSGNLGTQKANTGDNKDNVLSWRQ